MSGSPKVAVITGASQGIGAGLVAAYRRAGYAVVATSRSIGSSDQPDFLTVQGDIAETETAQRVVEQALGRFGRIDSLINNAGVFIGKPFTEYSPDDYAAITAVNLAGFFHVTQRAIRQMVGQRDGHVVNVITSLVDQPDSKRPSALASFTKGGLAARALSGQPSRSVTASAESSVRAGSAGERGALRRARPQLQVKRACPLRSGPAPGRLAPRPARARRPVRAARGGDARRRPDAGTPHRSARRATSCGVAIARDTCSTTSRWIVAPSMIAPLGT